jgi:diguanylate cyclase (GGDEF)-like protein
MIISNIKELLFYPQIPKYAKESFTKHFIQADKVLLVIMLLHWIVASFITAITYDTYLYGFISGGVIFMTLFIAYKYFKGTYITRLLMGIAMMLFSLIFIQQHLGRIEMHFHVFIGMAILVLYKDIIPIVAASITTTLHHLVFNYLQLYEISLFGMPVMVFNYGCGFDIVMLHAIFVLVEAIVIGYIIKLQREYVLDIDKSKNEVKELNQELSFTSLHDPLTGLANRSNLQIQLEIAIHNANRNQNMFALLFVDLDHFKNINDTLGHDVGDALLKVVARRFKSTLREKDIIARIGGDEFVIVLTDIQNTYAIEQVINKLLHLFKHEWNILEHNLKLSCSIGVALYPDDTHEIEELMKYADIAMYQAKANGRNQFIFFTSELNELVHKEVELTAEMYTALKENEFKLYLQPKMDLNHEQVIGAEALIRWEHPTKGLIPPDAFIPISEKNGFITKLGEWVIYESARIASHIAKEGYQNIHISCNVSVLQLHDFTIVKIIQNALEQYQLDPKLISIEITETVMMEEYKLSIEILKQIKELGIKICMDDFGTGYSSLASLQNLPIDSLKIDKSFVDCISDKADTTLIDTILAMGNALNLAVIAEGVENEKQKSYLQSHGCNYAQGYLYSKPINEEAFLKYLHSYS